jgi:hypothetical protein
MLEQSEHWQLEGRRMSRDNPLGRICSAENMAAIPALELTALEYSLA